MGNDMKKVIEMGESVYNQFKRWYAPEELRTLITGYLMGLVDCGLYHFDAEEVMKHFNNLIERDLGIC